MDAYKQSFFETNAPLAIQEQIRYGIPASVTLIQMWWESGGGKSEIARDAHNYFGVKDHAGAAAGRPVYRHDDKDEKNAPFKVYDSKEASVRGHSLVLMGNNYKSLRQLSPDDYSGWLHGLKRCGYASAAGYDTQLIADLEAYHLQKYDRKALEEAKALGVKCGYMRGVSEAAPASRRAAVIGAAQFSMPLKDVNGRLVMASDFGHRDTKIPGASKYHKGIDLRANFVPVFSTESEGRVIKTDSIGNSKNGKFVAVEYKRDGHKYTVYYLHLSKVGVQVGDVVGAGQQLGVSGNSSYRDFDPKQKSLAPHLHFQVMKDGTVYNPKQYLADIAVYGRMDTTLVSSNDPSRHDLLAERRGDVEPRPDDVLLAQSASVKEEQQADSRQYDQIIQEDVRNGAKSSGLWGTLLSGLGMKDLGADFQGDDLTSGLLSMLLMSLLAFVGNKGEGKQEGQSPELVRDHVNDYDVRGERKGVDVAAVHEMASTYFDLHAPERSSGQQVQRQENEGMSLS